MSRPHNVQRLFFLLHWFGKKTPIKGIRLKNLLAVKSGHVYDYYIPEKEWKNFLEKIGKNILKNDLLDHKKIFKREMKEFLKAARVFGDFGPKIKNLSNDKLNKFFSKIEEKEIIFAKYAFIPWAIDLYLFPILEKRLNKIDKEKCSKWLEIISEPTKRSALSRHQLDLIKLKLSRSMSKEKIKKHLQKYSWLPIYNIGDKLWSEKDLHYQLSQISNPEKSLKQNIENFQERLKNYQKAIKEINPNRSLRRLINFIHEYTFLRDERVDIWKRELIYKMIFYKEIARRFKLNIFDVVNLTNEEIFILLKSGKSGNLKSIKKRKAEHLMFIQNRELKIVIDKSKIEKIKKRYLNLELGQKILKGFVAFKGKILGKARVITDQKKVREFKNGEILVAHHTSPAYIVAIKKAAAVVTDEGGITSHAAIISRELKIPCITATKMASKIIKTGDLVEVNANEGIVKILKRA